MFSSSFSVYLLCFWVSLGRPRLFPAGGFGREFWYLGRGFLWVDVLLGSRSFAWELGKVGYIAGALHTSAIQVWWRYLIQHNVGKQSTQSRLDARNKPIILNNNHFDAKANVLS